MGELRRRGKSKRPMATSIRVSEEVKWDTRFTFHCTHLPSLPVSR